MSKAIGTKSVIYTYNGIVGTASEWARQLGINPSILCTRLKKTGGDLEKALALPYAAKNRRDITYQGKTMTLGEWARELGMSQSTLYRRIVKLGMSMEDAVGLPPYNEQRLRPRGKKTLMQPVELPSSTAAEEEGEELPTADTFTQY